MDIFKAGETATTKYAISYYDYEKNGYYAYKNYESESSSTVGGMLYQSKFNKALFLEDGGDLTDIQNLDFIVLVKDGIIEVRAQKYIEVGDYIVRVQLSDMWTPSGMMKKEYKSNTIIIKDSAYDDWYVGR